MQNVGISYMQFPTNVANCGIPPDIWQPSCLRDKTIYQGFSRKSIQVASDQYGDNLNWWLANMPPHCITPPDERSQLMYMRGGHTLPIIG